MKQPSIGIMISQGVVPFKSKPLLIKQAPKETNLLGTMQSCVHNRSGML